MSLDLNRPLAWKSATGSAGAMLSDLQGNILKGHGRHVTRHLFLEFINVEAGAAFVRGIASLVTPALQALQQAELHRITKASGGPVLFFFLTAQGYEFLGRSTKAPQDPAFLQGMRARAGLLADPDLAANSEYRAPIHAKILIAGDAGGESDWTSEAVDRLETAVLNQMSGAARVVASEAGRAIFNGNGDGLEHFGYVDGRSQPLFLEEDIAREAADDGIDQWDPTFPLSQVLVEDPGSTAAEAMGSYFVFRKLEQDVEAFKTAEEALGDRTGGGEFAGASLVGRWEDGTALGLATGGTPGQFKPISNNFNYDDDPDGLKCPLHAHVRKTNPRGFRAPIMARRGMPYGRRDRIVDPTDRPGGDVGLLFMAYQSNIEAQFEFTQIAWANAKNFPVPDTGLDPIIGQPEPGVFKHPNRWNDASAGFTEAEFPATVTYLGGEYFFAPAISTLRAF